MNYCRVVSSLFTPDRYSQQQQMSNIQAHENLYYTTWVLLLPDVDESSNRDGVMIMRVATKSETYFSNVIDET